jgi:hypothetical protein
MNPSNTPETGPTRAELAAQLSQELIHLRDALVSLSINLKDWQFELDQNGQRHAQAIVKETLERVRLQSSSGADARNGPFRSSASKG